MYFAKIDYATNLVTKVIVSDQDFADEQPGIWVKFDPNDENSPKNYPGKGYKFDLDRFAFLPPKAFDSWSLNEETCQWESPTPKPEDENKYYWNEEEQSWVEVE